MGVAGGQQFEPPYPLLIVRPNGIMAYTAARVSMTAWDDQFGYELVPADVELAFPKPDATLAKRTEEVIAESVRRRAAIVSAVPSRYRPGLSGSDPIGEVIQEASQRQFAGSGRRGMQRGEDGSRSQSSASGMQQPMQRWSQNADSSLASEQSSVQSNSTVGSGVAQAKAYELGDLTRVEGDQGSNGLGSQDRSGSGGEGSAGTSGTQTESLANNDPNNVGTSLTGTPQGDATTGTDAAPSSSSTAINGVSASATGAAGQASPQGMGTATEMDADPQSMRNASVSMAAPLSDQRGNGWAMRGTGGSSTGPAVVRNLTMQCFANRFVVLGDSSSDTEVILVDPQNPEAAIVRLAGVVRDRVDRWGLALAGGRWQPILQVAVAEGGQDNFDSLSRLLEGSGISVKARSVR
ncbi:MAG: hypothetical protein R3C05_30575 [Pirellulaceae bacterium]